MENLRLGPGPGPAAFLPAYPPAAAAPFSSYAAAEWHAARSVPGLAPGYLQPAQQAELFTAQDLLAAGPGADYRSEGKGEEGEDYEPGAEGEGKTRSKMQEKNRRAQKRFRERQKTKFAELTSKVEALEARLAGALADKAKSDDRAAILERCLELRGGGAPAAATATGAAPGEGPSADSSAAATAAAVAALALAAPCGAKDDAFAESVAPVSSVFADDLELSLPLGGVQRLTPEVFRLMTPRDVIELYESYVEAIGVCLEQESVEDDASPAHLRLTKLVHEISTVVCRAAALHPVPMRRMHMHVNPSTPACLQENVNLSRQLVLLLGLSSAQSQKLVGVSARFRRRAHELQLARRELYAGMRPPSEAALRACSEEYVRNFLQAHDDMDALRCNLRQEHWEVLNWVTKCFEILSPVQAARFMLGSHPRWFDFLSLSAVLAADLSLPMT